MGSSSTAGSRPHRKGGAERFGAGSISARIFTEYKIHVSTELHATKFINGRAQITASPPARFLHQETGAVQWKLLGREVAQRCLTVLRDCPDIRVGAAYRRTSLTGPAYGAERHDVYVKLVKSLDMQLAATDSYGFITMDGVDPKYRDAHRQLKLDTRHIIEDPAYHDSRHSQWTQMADLVAYTANLQLAPRDGNTFGRTWFTDYLASPGAIATL